MERSGHEKQSIGIIKIKILLKKINNNNNNNIKIEALKNCNINFNNSVLSLSGSHV